MSKSAENHGDNFHHLKQQIADLQSNVAYLELTVDSLDLVIAKQDKQIQDMQRQLQLLFVQLIESVTGIAPFDAKPEVPHIINPSDFKFMSS